MWSFRARINRGILLPLLLAGCASDPSASSGFRSPEKVVISPGIRPETIRVDLAFRKARQELPADSFRAFSEVLAWYRTHVSDAETQFLNILLFEDLGYPDSATADVVYAFLRKPYWRDLLDSVAQRFPAEDTLFAPFFPPLQRYYALFPDEPMPTVCTYVTGYQEPGAATLDPFLVGETHVGKLYLGLGLHYFLGPDFPWYPSDIPLYVRRRFDRQHMVPGALLQLIARRMPDAPPSAREPLLNPMIRAGIRYYALDVLLPDTPDSLKIGYTSPQMVFATEYLDRVWHELLPLLYDGEQLNYRHWLDDAPYTKGLAPESPPRLGAYVGWQIVRAYIRRHPDVRLRDLLKTTDYDRILRESGFRP